jgi:hypothetical protein
MPFQLRHIFSAMFLSIGLFIATATEAAIVANANIDIPGFGSSYIGQTALFYLGPVNLGTYSAGSGNGYLALTSGPEFDFLVNTFTNGIDDSLGYSISTFSAGGVSTSTVPESVFFNGAPGQKNGIDLAGSSIGEIDFFVTNNISSPGSDPNHDGIWTDYAFSVNMQVQSVSSVPLPSAIVLLGSGLLTLFPIARSRRKSQG